MLIADEPTTALDVTIQAQVLEVLERIQERTNSAIVLITHDLGVVAGVADRVLVMYAGRPVETGTVDELFYASRHPYTLGLLASLPRLDTGEKSDRLYRIKGQPPVADLRALRAALFTLDASSPGSRIRAPLRRPAMRLVQHEYATHMSACHFAETLSDDSMAELHAEIGRRARPRARTPAGPSETEAAALEGLSRPPGARVVTDTEATTATPTEPANPQAGGASLPVEDKILEVRDLVKHFPIRAGLFRTRGRLRRTPCAA